LVGSRLPARNHDPQGLDRPGDVRARADRACDHPYRVRTPTRVAHRLITIWRKGASIMTGLEIVLGVIVVAFVTMLINTFRIVPQARVGIVQRLQLSSERRKRTNGGHPLH